jgi:hypothetical protein
VRRLAIEGEVHDPHRVAAVGEARLAVEVAEVGLPEWREEYQTCRLSSRQPTAMKSRQASIDVMQSASWIDYVYRKFLEFAYISKRYCESDISNTTDGLSYKHSSTSIPSHPIHPPPTPSTNDKALIEFTGIITP